MTSSDVEFVRDVAQRIYGIPPEQMIGSTVNYRYSQTNSAISPTRLAQVDNRVDGGPSRLRASKTPRRPLSASA